MKMRYHSYGHNIMPTIKKNYGSTSYTWEFLNLEKHKFESHGPNIHDQFPYVITAPAHFEIEGYAGNMSTWKSFGKWYHLLSKDSNDLPDEALDKIKRMTAHTTDKLEITAILYDYLQTTTRYISVQLGIGGWKPFPASYVYENGYGDCKALVNYMVTMLDVAGVEAYPVLTKREYSFTDIQSDFPSSQFNHVVLFVPLKSDSIWLECTSQSIPFGHLGADNEDRHALLIKPDGGKLIKTPISISQNNKQVRVSVVNLRSSRSITTKVKTLFTGSKQDDVRIATINKSVEEKEKWLKNSIHAEGFSLVNSNFGEIDVNSRSIVIRYDLKLEQSAPKSEKRLFVNVTNFVDHVTIPPNEEERNHQIILDYPYTQIDSIYINTPTHFSVESIPKSHILTTNFGKYSLETIPLEKNKILYIRQLEISQRKIEPRYYIEFVKFFKDISKNDKRQLVFVKEQ